MDTLDPTFFEDGDLDKSLIEEFLASPASTSKYHPLDLKDPIELLNLFDDNIAAGKVSPHKWQDETLRFVAQPGIFTFKEKLKLSMPAANGSGKDSYFITPLTVWLLLTQIRHKIVITSASYTQLSTQTEAGIRSLCERVNAKLADLGVCPKALIVKKEYIFCMLTGAQCIMFSTDNPGRAEGHHPPSDCPEAEETIIINESKTLPDNIFEALSRCTYNRWIEVSSPGGTTGQFYDHCTSKSTIHWPEPYVPGVRYTRRITSYDCPHKSIQEIEQDREEMGENSPLFRSKHLAEFTSLDEQVVITMDQTTKCLRNPPAYKNLGLGRRAGLDLAKGGDENTLYVFDENLFVGSEKFRAHDTAEVTVPVLIAFFHKYQLKPENIFADDGGVGGVIIDNLKKQGWPVNRVVSQSAPIKDAQFLGNRGAELWFSFARLIQECCIQLPSDDTKLFHQLSSRYYKQHASQGRIILEAKSEARAKGHGSPDRADAVVLAWTGISIHRFIDYQAPEKPKARHVCKTLQEIEEYYDDYYVYRDKQIDLDGDKEALVFGSITTLVNSRYKGEDIYANITRLIARN